MTEEENKLMEIYGITTEAKTVYLYDKYKYDKLSDAVQYAKINMKNSHLRGAFDDNLGVQSNL